MTINIIQINNNKRSEITDIHLIMIFNYQNHKF